MFKQIINLVVGSKSTESPAKGKDISFCESYGEVCNTDCRSNSVLSEAKDKYSAFQTGVAGRY
jgi:hypothetical protein